MRPWIVKRTLRNSPGSILSQEHFPKRLYKFDLRVLSLLFLWTLLFLAKVLFRSIVGRFLPLACNLPAKRKSDVGRHIEKCTSHHG